MFPPGKNPKVIRMVSPLTGIPVECLSLGSVKWKYPLGRPWNSLTSSIWKAYSSGERWDSKLINLLISLLFSRYPAKSADRSITTLPMTFARLVLRVAAPITKTIPVSVQLQRISVVKKVRI